MYCSSFYTMDQLSTQADNCSHKQYIEPSQEKTPKRSAHMINQIVYIHSSQIVYIHSSQITRQIISERQKQVSRHVSLIRI